MALPPPVRITAPPLVPPRVSLVSAAGRNAADVFAEARTDRDQDPDRWMDGVAFDPETCLEAEAWWDCVGTEGAAPVGTKELDPGTANPEVVTFHPWYVWHGDVCTTLQWRTRGGRERALRALAARESQQIAGEFWHGTIAQAADLPNGYLMDANLDQLLSGNAQPYLMALTALQREGALCSPGRGMIHATHDLVSLWVTEHALRREGDLLLDAFDNIVVADAGYDGAGPDVADPELGDQYQWAYFTDVVQVWRGQAEVYGDPERGEFDPGENTVQWLAERPAMVTWSPCCQLGVKVDMYDACGPYDPTPPIG